MSENIKTEPLGGNLRTPYVYTLIVLMVIGLLPCIFRFTGGLGAVTNLNNSYPWGIWKAFSVAAAVALATSGFTTAALVHIFHRERYAPLLRPALLVGLLGYTFGAASLFVDIGRYYNIWHPAWPSMWQPNSALFEVSICIMTYLTIMYVEFMPIVCERYIGKVNLPGVLACLNSAVDRFLRWLKPALNNILSVILVLGVVLSCMHHSSLGSLMLIAKHKMHPLWFTPILPLLFLLSVFAVGFAVVICESLAVSWGFKRRCQMEVLKPLSFYILYLLGFYMIAKISDLLIRDAQVHLFEASPESILFLVEVVLGVILPFVMLISNRVRSSALPLGIACGLIVFGVIMNRLNVFITAYASPYATERYFPSVSEVLITVGLISMFLLLHRIAISYLPIPAYAEKHAVQAEAGKSFAGLEQAR